MCSTNGLVLVDHGHVGSEWYVERLAQKYPHRVKMFSVHLYGNLRDANKQEVMIFPGMVPNPLAPTKNTHWQKQG